MCKITPILNGKDNLCWVSRSLNITKHNNPKNEHVIKYIKGRNHQIWLTIAAIQSSVARADPLHKQVKDFAASLVIGLQKKYGTANIYVV